MKKRLTLTNLPNFSIKSGNDRSSEKYSVVNSSDVDTAKFKNKLKKEIEYDIRK